jgi:hypothetical protein
MITLYHMLTILSLQLLFHDEILVLRYRYRYLLTFFKIHPQLGYRYLLLREPMMLL